MIPLLVLLGISAGVSTTVGVGYHVAKAWASRKSQEDLDGPDPDQFSAEALPNGRVRVYTPHIGMTNPYNRDVMAAPGVSRWTLEGYRGETAIWEAEARDAALAAEVINAQHFFKQNYERLFIYGDWREEDIRLWDFVEKAHEDGNE